MGLEREKSDSSVIMDQDEFNRAIEPMLSKKARSACAAEPDRDPSDVNAHLKVGFDDIIAEPGSAHSFDTVWIGSHAAFELVKFIFYRVLTTLLAVPVAFILGLVFAVLSCIHIWLVTPLIRSFVMLLPPARVVWRSLTDTFVTPLFLSVGKSLSSVRVKTTEY
ncbi:caveolin-2 [Cyclopterus lumpus]|uniref:Caveolin n=1 Tax=Cyclopterus lumpus TaxID=8103 RepID=A0A8C2XQ90_CYCLU|nr:caveolin-2 [Cyclopterus lumpus]